MFYVIRDDYCGYGFEIIGEASTESAAFNLMKADVAEYIESETDIKSSVCRYARYKDGCEYHEEALHADVNLWNDGALIEGCCRWGIDEWKGDRK